MEGHDHFDDAVKVGGLEQIALGAKFLGATNVLRRTGTGQDDDRDVRNAFVLEAREDLEPVPAGKVRSSRRRSGKGKTTRLEKGPVPFKKSMS